MTRTFAVLVLVLAVPAFAETTRVLKSTPGSAPEVFAILKDGREVGRETVEPSGSVRRSGSIPDGVVKEYGGDGKIRAEWNYRFQKRHGLAKVYKDPNTVLVYMYEKDVKRGEFEFDLSDPKLRQKIARLESRWNTSLSTSRSSPHETGSEKIPRTLPQKKKGDLTEMEIATASRNQEAGGAPSQPSDGSSSSEFGGGSDAKISKDARASSGSRSSPDTRASSAATAGSRASSDLRAQSESTSSSRAEGASAAHRSYETAENLASSRARENGAAVEPSISRAALPPPNVQPRSHTFQPVTASTARAQESTKPESSTNAAAAVPPSVYPALAPLGPNTSPIVGGRVFTDATGWHDVGGASNWDYTQQVNARLDFSSHLGTQGEWTTRVDGAADFGVHTGVHVKQGIQDRFSWDLFRAVITSQNSTTRFDLGRQEILLSNATLFRPLDTYDNRDFGVLLFESKPVNAIRAQHRIFSYLSVDGFLAFGDNSLGVSGGARVGIHTGPVETQIIAHYRAPEERTAFGILRTFKGLLQIGASCTADVGPVVYADTRAEFEEGTKGVQASQVVGARVELDESGRWLFFGELMWMYRNADFLSSPYNLLQDSTGFAGVGLRKAAFSTGWIGELFVAADFGGPSVLTRGYFGYAFPIGLRAVIHGQYSKSIHGGSTFYQQPFTGLPWTGREASIGLSAVITF